MEEDAFARLKAYVMEDSACVIRCYQACHKHPETKGVEQAYTDVSKKWMGK